MRTQAELRRPKRRRKNRQLRLWNCLGFSRWNQRRNHEWKLHYSHPGEKVGAGEWGEWAPGYDVFSCIRCGERRVEHHAF